MAEHRTCSIEGCDEPMLSRDWCRKHYMRWKRHGDPLAETRRYVKQGEACAVGACERTDIKARGYCHAHYQQWQKGSLTDAAIPSPIRVCTVDGCEKLHKARGYCEGHYQRWLKNGEPGPAELQEKVARPDRCTFGGCADPVVARELCGGHYRQQLDGRPLQPKEKRGKRGEGYVTKDGYRIISIDGTPILEHRYVMSQHLGRPLHSWETVDHLTEGFAGRSNNRLSNLRLMVGKHPRGHDPENVVRYARQMLGLYGTAEEQERYGAERASIDEDERTERLARNPA